MLVILANIGVLSMNEVVYFYCLSLFVFVFVFIFIFLFLFHFYSYFDFLGKEEDDDKRREWYEQAIKLEPTQPHALDNLGIYYFDHGLRISAIIVFVCCCS